MNKELKIIDRIQIKNAIRLVIGGWVFDGADITDVPNLLEEIKTSYEEIIKNLKQKIK